MLSNRVGHHLYTILTSQCAQRQDNLETASNAGLAARRQRSTMPLDDLAADRQAQPGPLRLGSQGVANLAELLEDCVDLDWRDAHAAVLDLDDRHAIGLARSHRDLASRCRELGGV